MVTNESNNLIFNNSKYSISNAEKSMKTITFLEGKTYEIFLYNASLAMVYKINKMIFFVFNVTMVFHVIR